MLFCEEQYKYERDFTQDILVKLNVKVLSYSSSFPTKEDFMTMAEIWGIGNDRVYNSGKVLAFIKYNISHEDCLATI